MQLTHTPISHTAKPFLKWAGGKTQLLAYIEALLPDYVRNGTPFTYIEPFVGSGAVFFHLMEQYNNIEHVVINDYNYDLIGVYKVIRDNVTDLINILQDYEKQYHSLQHHGNSTSELYYTLRDTFNDRKNDDITHAACFIFLNRTCFNGLYRVNSRNNFNVPEGRYKKPKICDEDNLRAVSDILKRATIICGDYEHTIDFAGTPSLFYFDPPYRPISKTSSFTSYSVNGFDDTQQQRLQQFCDIATKYGYQWILSNSDPKNLDAADDFFDNLYAGNTIHRVPVRRSINAKATGRGTLMELLISNTKL